MTLTELELSAPTIKPVRPKAAAPLAAAIAVTLAASCVTAAVGVGGARSGRVSASELTQLRSSAQRIAHLRSYSLHLHETITVAGETHDVDLDVQKDVAHKLSHETSAAGDLGRIEVVTAGTTVYARKVGASHWTAAAIPSGLTSLTTTGSSASSSLDLLAALDQVSDKGSRTIGGVRTEHYRGVLAARLLGKLTTALASFLPTDSGLSQEQLKTITDVTVKALSKAPIDVYVDGQGRPVEMDMDASIDVLGHTIAEKVVSTYSDFDAPVHVTVPDDSQVTKVGSLTELFAGITG